MPRGGWTIFNFQVFKNARMRAQDERSNESCDKRCVGDDGHLREEPYRSAHRVFLITDSGFSHRGRRAAIRTLSSTRSRVGRPRLVAVNAENRPKGDQVW
jgi:hypothetical protein